MSGIEIGMLVAGGIASFVSFVNTIVTNRRLRKGLKLAKEESCHAKVQLEKLASALGIVSEDEEMSTRGSDPYRNLASPNSESSIVSIKCKYDRKTGEIILPEGL